MKITDKVLQRTIDLALVAKPAANAVFGGEADWSRPVCYEVSNSSETFVRMPHGKYEVGVISRHAVNLLLQVERQRSRRVSVRPPRVALGAAACSGSMAPSGLIAQPWSFVASNTAIPPCPHSTEQRALVVNWCSRA